MIDFICGPHLECVPVDFQPGEIYETDNRLWQGCPTVCAAPGGTLYCGWYSGGTCEPSPFNYNLLVRSDNGGRSWSEPVLVIPSVPVKKLRAIDIQLWLDPSGRMWIFWCQRCDFYPKEDYRHLSTWAIVAEKPDEPTPQWSTPRRVSDGFLRSQPTVLSDGRWLLFAYDWGSTRYRYSESSDQGKTWCRCEGGLKLPTPFDEAMALEHRDGSIRILARSDSGFLAESVSRDGGRTWSDGVPSSIVAPSSRPFVRRLTSGNVLLIANHHPTMRTNLTASLSTDDGHTFPYSLILDRGEPVSYPDAVELANGHTLVVYDHGRNTFKEIVCAEFSEADLLAGYLIDHDSRLGQIISKAPDVIRNLELFNAQKFEEEKYFAKLSDSENV